VLAELQIRGDAYLDALRIVPFKYGQIITPRVGSIYKGAGQPHRVIDLDHEAVPDFTGGPQSLGYGHRHQVRVLYLNGDTYFPFWGEAGAFEEWDESKLPKDEQDAPSIAPADPVTDSAPATADAPDETAAS
jgi:hypothetical protein